MHIYYISVFEWDGSSCCYLISETKYSEEDFDNLISDVFAECAIIEESDYWSLDVFDMAINLLIRNYGFEKLKIEQTFGLRGSFKIEDEAKTRWEILVKEKYNQKLKEKITNSKKV